MKTMSRKLDLHIHTTVSDGTDTPREIPGLVRKAGIGLFSVTDHDAIKGGVQVLKVRREDDPCFITGAEFSCQDEEGKYHILGYGYDPGAKAIRDLAAYGHSLRMKKVRARLDFLHERFGFYFPEEALGKLLSQDNPGKPHIANLMVRLGYTSTKEEGIRRYIDQLRLENEYMRPEIAIAGILGAGGIPVLAHPVFGSGDQLILGEELDERVRKLMGFGLKGLECFYSGFTKDHREQSLALADRYDLYVTAGSDYHGTNKLVELGDNGLETVSAWPEGLIRFLEDVNIVGNFL